MNTTDWEVTRYGTIGTLDFWVQRRGNPKDGHYWRAGPYEDFAKLGEYRTALAAKRAVCQAFRPRRRFRWRATEWVRRNLKIILGDTIAITKLGTWSWSWMVTLSTPHNDDKVSVHGVEDTYERAKERAFAAAERLQRIGPRLLPQTKGAKCG